MIPNQIIMLVCIVLGGLAGVLFESGRRSASGIFFTIGGWLVVIAAGIIALIGARF